MDGNLAGLKENRFDFVHDSQKVFRTLLASLASPGSIHFISALPLCMGRPELTCILQPFLTLLDLETTFFVHAEEPGLRAQVIRYLEINTNSAHADRDEADYILCLEPTLRGGFAALKRGCLTMPNASATVFYLVHHLLAASNNGATELSLSGPGIKNRQSVYVSGIGADELADWDRYRRDYPMGIDIYLVGRSGEIAGLPRSTVINR